VFTDRPQGAAVAGLSRRRISQKIFMNRRWLARFPRVIICAKWRRLKKSEIAELKRTKLDQYVEGLCHHG
jgi:hypothetical protein